MMKHIDEKILWDYFLDDEKLDNLEEIKQHLEVCPKCRSSYETQLTLHHELSELTNNAPSLSFSRNVMNKVEENVRVEKATQFWLGFTKNSIIGAIIIALTIPSLMIIFQKVEMPLYYYELNKTMLTVSGSMLLLWVFYLIDVFLSKKLFENGG